MTSYPGPSLDSNSGPNPNPKLLCAGVVEPKPELRPESARAQNARNPNPSLNPSPSSTQLPLRYAVALFEGLALQGPLGNVERLRVRIATGNA